MQSSKNSREEESSLENERLRVQLEAAHEEIKVLRDKLLWLESLLNQASDRSDRQAEQIHTMSEQSVVDAATIFANTEQLKNQSSELDDARKALLLQAELEAANKELETFSYSVSHDLRSPLRAINGFAKALTEDYGDSLPEEARSYLEHIENSAIKMGTLIDDLLSFSRLSRLELTKSQVDMNGLALSVWSELTAEPTDRKLQFHASGLPKVSADRAMLRQVLLNLIGNAIKFTAPQPVANITLSHEESHGQVIFCVKDNGVGFDNRYTDKLFGPFQRLHKAKDFPGTGIGLALVQRIIHRHGGIVRADSQVGQGASFYFSIPMEREK